MNRYIDIARVISKEAEEYANKASGMGDAWQKAYNLGVSHGMQKALLKLLHTISDSRIGVRTEQQAPYDGFPVPEIPNYYTIDTRDEAYSGSTVDAQRHAEALRMHMLSEHDKEVKALEEAKKKKV